MGTFGAGIYDDDVAQDARDAFLELLDEGLDEEAATRRFRRSWSGPLKDSDDGPVVWYALADTQWSLGRLLDQVRDEAVRRIDAEAGLDRWRDAGPKPLAQRRKVLAAFRE